MTNAEIEKAAPMPFSRELYPDGINLIGPIESTTGLGQSCRLVAQMIGHSKVPVSIHAYNPLNSRKSDSGLQNIHAKDLLYNINVIHINAQEMPLSYVQLGRSVWDGRYNIAFWLWESEHFPPEWLPALNLVDEIWTPSDFAGIAVKKHTQKPVITMLYPLYNVSVEECFNRAYFNLPEKVFLFFCTYDSASVEYRKNPLSAAKAFKEAFREGNVSCGLVIKAGHAADVDLEPLKAELYGLENIFFIREELTRNEMNGLLQCVDVYVSLHRAEGFALVCAEAMFLGKPVIATNWSANTEFMTPEDSCLVNCTLKPLDRDYGPFIKGTYWAEPDVMHAAAYMQKLYETPDFYAGIAQRAHINIADALDIKKASEHVRQRINEIYLSERTNL